MPGRVDEPEERTGWLMVAEALGCLCAYHTGSEQGEKPPCEKSARSRPRTGTEDELVRLDSRIGILFE